MIHIIEGTIFIDDMEAFLKKIRKISKEKNIVIQALNTDKLAGKEHLMFAIEKAMISYKTGKNMANDPSKEIMLYAAGTRQINRAIRIGIHNGNNNIALVAIGEHIDLSDFSDIVQKNVLQYDKSKNADLMDVFNITDEEIHAVGADRIPELVIERVALVDILK